MVLNYPIIHINGGLNDQIICGGLYIAMFDGVFLPIGTSNMEISPRYYPRPSPKKCASRTGKLCLILGL